MRIIGTVEKNDIIDLSVCCVYARRLARLNGENPNSWEVVARYLTLKAEPEFYENEVVRCGRFTGSRQTLAYVNDVIGRYDRYCRIAGR